MIDCTGVKPKHSVHLTWESSALTCDSFGLAPPPDGPVTNLTKAGLAGLNEPQPVSR